MSVWLHVCRITMKPTSAPRCFGSSVSSFRVSEAALKRIVGHILVSQAQRPQTFRKGEDRVKVSGGKNILFPCVQPPLLVQSLALGAVAVPAGVVGYPQSATMVTSILMAPKLRSATDLDGSHRAAMPHRQLMVMAISWTMDAEDIGHFKAALHQKPSSRGWLLITS